MLISLIVAAAENNIIGKDNQLVWHLPNDMKFFKNTTWGMPVIMGRKTYEAVGKPFPGRINIIVSRQADWKVDGAVVVRDLEEARLKAEETNCREAFIIGGGDIYRQAIERADKIYITRVHAQLEGDTSFPVIDADKWKQTFNQDFPADEKHAYPYSFQTWERI
ncbi:MAG: dihydrofolate reductase [Chitinophagaceae bacterium]|nr:dihydrofolate reductase [Chitinophagaceae bacterium]MBL0055990.1 dihydrofolate reductase [Chitinophagaceae bacterium]